MREYRDGDDLRRIHWPASARTSGLMVRQEDRPAKRRAVVILDCRASGHAGSGRSGSLEWCVTTAASVTPTSAPPASGAPPHRRPGLRHGHRIHDESLEAGLDTLARVTPGPTTGCERCSTPPAPSPPRAVSSSTWADRWPTTTPAPSPRCGSRLRRGRDGRRPVGVRRAGPRVGAGVRGATRRDDQRDPAVLRVDGHRRRRPHRAGRCVVRRRRGPGGGGPMSRARPVEALLAAPSRPWPVALPSRPSSRQGSVVPPGRGARRARRPHRDGPATASRRRARSSSSVRSCCCLHGAPSSTVVATSGPTSSPPPRPVPLRRPAHRGLRDRHQLHRSGARPTAGRSSPSACSSGLTAVPSTRSVSPTAARRWPASPCSPPSSRRRPTPGRAGRLVRRARGLAWLALVGRQGVRSLRSWGTAASPPPRGRSPTRRPRSSRWAGSSGDRARRRRRPAGPHPALPTTFLADGLGQTRTVAGAPGRRRLSSSVDIAANLGSRSDRSVLRYHTTSDGPSPCASTSSTGTAEGSGESRSDFTLVPVDGQIPARRPGQNVPRRVERISVVDNIIGVPQVALPAGTIGRPFAPGTWNMAVQGLVR